MRLAAAALLAVLAACGPERDIYVFVSDTQGFVESRESCRGDGGLAVEVGSCDGFSSRTARSECDGTTCQVFPTLDNGLATDGSGWQGNALGASLHLSGCGGYADVPLPTEFPRAVVMRDSGGPFIVTDDSAVTIYEEVSGIDSGSNCRYAAPHGVSLPSESGLVLVEGETTTYSTDIGDVHVTGAAIFFGAER